MNKELVLILYSLRCKALQTDLCRQIGRSNRTSAICRLKFECLICPLNINRSTRRYPDQIAITSLNLYME